jgi:hypothetical protein
MKIPSFTGKFLLTALLFLLFAPVAVLAQDDNTGTNPINFTYDARFYMEMSDLASLNGSALTNTFEFRAPLGRTLANLAPESLGMFSDLGSKYALRIKARTKSLSLDDTEGSAFESSSVSGIGDMDVRFLAIPFVNQKYAVAAGVEGYFPTATNDALGTGRVAVVPQVFLGFFGVLGGRSMFVPGYLYVLDAGGDDDRVKVNQHKLDIYFVWILADLKNWLIINPQMNFDRGKDLEGNAAHKNIYLVDAEFGFMIPPVPGASTYLRPGVGFGDDKPFDWTFEFGLKFIWR